ncbi:MAG: hypothetical protein ACTIH2_09370 [Anaerococcus sp.]
MTFSNIIDENKFVEIIKKGIQPHVELTDFLKDKCGDFNNRN